MIRMAILFPRRDGARFDVDYFLNSHLPMLRERLVPMGMVSVRAEKAIDMESIVSPYQMVIRMDFSELQDLRRALRVHGPAIMADMPNYTDVSPVAQLGEQVFE